MTDTAAHTDAQIERLANLARRSKSIAFQLHGGGWVRVKLSNARRERLAKLLDGERAEEPAGKPSQ
jgi:hypothetical protein